MPPSALALGATRVPGHSDGYFADVGLSLATSRGEAALGAALALRGLARPAGGAQTPPGPGHSPGSMRTSLFPGKRGRRLPFPSKPPSRVSWMAVAKETPLAGGPVLWQSGAPGGGVEVPSLFTTPGGRAGVRAFPGGRQGPGKMGPRGGIFIGGKGSGAIKNSRASRGALKKASPSRIHLRQVGIHQKGAGGRCDLRGIFPSPRSV